MRSSEYHNRVVFAPEGADPDKTFLEEFEVQGYPSFHKGEIVTLHCGLDNFTDHKTKPNFIERNYEKYEVVEVRHLFSKQHILYDIHDTIIRINTVTVIVKPYKNEL